MYGKSNLNEKNYHLFINSLTNITRLAKSKKINILIESNISAQSFKALKQEIEDKDHFFFLYDTGNRLSKESNYLKEIITLSKDIKHIHIKDKNFYKKNVILGHGNVDFSKIFTLLKKIQYKGNFTLETNKGINPIIIAKKHILIVKKLIKKIK